MNESRAFIELINYIEKSVDSGVLLFKLSEIHSLYVSRLGELGIKKLVNKTRLKDHLLEHLPEARAQCDGKNTLLIFKEGLKNMLKEALNKRNFDKDALILAKAAKIIRNDIINHSGFQFTGSFPEKCQENALPSSLKSLVSMVLNGSNIKHQEKCDSQACLTIGQCIVYHTKKRASSTAMKTRHTLEREPPLPIYIGINVHAQTRSKKLVQQLHNLGISISYDRIMQIEDWLATSTCEGFEADGVVAPACLRKGLFTVGALDNLDHNPSSTTSVTSFHGTGISLFQLPTKSEPEGSGWTTALTEADVASSGMAESFLKAAHLTRTRHAHQVTLLTLHNLQQEAFRLSAGPKDEEYLMAWRNEMLKKSPTFMFWDLIMRYETLILIFIRAHRERNFPLYVEVLEVLAPLFFALDHVNYSRWMPVHIRDMKSLPNTIKDEFENNSHWVLSKTYNKFSAIPFDQAHEQENKNVKGSGGAVGLTENPNAFRRWMLSGPEMARLLKEFEEEYLQEDDKESFQHHEQGLATQKTFQRQVISLSETIRRMGNPFFDDFKDLVTLDSRNCADESVVNTVLILEDTGKRQYQEFVKKVLDERTGSIHDPIKRNSLALFRQPRRKTVLKHGKIKVLQNNVALFGQLYIAMQSRESNLDEFFAHEVQSFPPSLSDFGKLHLTGTKSDLLQCLEQPGQSEPPSIYDCKVLDGAVIVHCLPTVRVSTFNTYADDVFIPYLQKQLQDTKRLDVVWDTYIPDSLKESTREKRGQGVRRKVSGPTKLPGNWMDFLRDPINKKELFDFLTSRIEEFSWPPTKALHVTSGQAVSSFGSSSMMNCCNHEEADTRIVVHVQHALEHGAKTVLVRTVDTDVIVILVGLFHDLLVLQPLTDIWVAFGMGRKYRFYHINNMCRSLGEPKSRALPMFHAYSGCDTTSAFNGKGKKSAWRAWQAYDDATETFVYLAKHPFQPLDVDCPQFQKLERLTVILYDKSSPLNSINQKRKELFCQENRMMEKLPPTQDALLQHMKRAIYQAGVWATSTQIQQVIPSPQDYGWTKESGSWMPVWLTIPEVSRACRELIKCSCKGDCCTCKCSNAHMDCSPLCKCNCNK
ncbi:hypothetical protein SKAU_G00209850 [Synaphobranchus kaupii]|uniref:Uncharacterized protein n=1 Tax=Synaphobranchus kaupii TaxID=118154 RepID=A0A9Q1IUX9_SYNKA|nr:hypothetical protein SKAU_G00209850 [Synaphobranchus kaupii]